MKPRVAGVILAGGRSTRMGGDEKALLHLGGQPLIAHIADRLRPQVADIAINANGDPARFDAYGFDVIADATDDHPGPLAGILAGLRWAVRRDYSHVATAPTDTPFFPGDLVLALTQALQGRGQVALAASAGARHPVIGVWATDLADALAEFLETDSRRKVTAFADQCGAVSVDFPSIPLAGGQSIDPFFNVNTPADLAAAEVALKALPA